MKLRIGQGFDVHAFAEGRKLVIGGVTINHPLGLAGHSDADVLVHAICDALLGALALGDIGHHFPDTDPKYRGINSMLLLGHVVGVMSQQGWQLNNLDCTIIAQTPKMAPHIAAMRQNLASVVGSPPDAINIKATTTEMLGFTGRKEGIAALATVLLAGSESHA